MDMRVTDGMFQVEVFHSPCLDDGQAIGLAVRERRTVVLSST